MRSLATEDGYDRVLSAEVQLCGFTFALVPGPNPSWAHSFKSRYPATTLVIFPVAQVLAHEKAAMLHHDLRVSRCQTRVSRCQTWFLVPQRLTQTKNQF